MVAKDGATLPRCYRAGLGQNDGTLGVWPLAVSSKKPGSEAFTALTQWAFDKKILAIVSSI